MPLISSGLVAERATPKSTSFTPPSKVTRMFVGVTSWCTMPRGVPSLSTRVWA